jgi:hypothetical protein
MATFSPDQVQAIANLLQQANAAQTGETYSIPAVLNTSAINTDNLSRLLLLPGTVTQVKLDELVLRTSQGEFAVRAQFPQNVPPPDSLLNSKVTLQLRPGPNGLEASLIVGNRPVAAGTQPDEILNTGTALSTRAQTLTAEVPKVGQVFGVTVLPSALFAAFAQNRPQGKDNPINSLAPQIGGTTQQQQEPPPETAGGASFFRSLQQKLGPSQHGFSGANASGLSPDTAPMLTNIKILSYASPGDALKIPVPGGIASAFSPASSPNASPHEVVTATVRGQTPSGQPILAVDDTLIAVRTARNWPVGTQVQMVIGGDADVLLPKDDFSAHSWQGVHQMLEILGLSSPALKEAVQARLPQTQNAKMATGLLFFLAAMQKGDVFSWIGREAGDRLESLGRADILRQLREEWDGRQFPAQDMAGTHWRGTMVPYLDQAHLKQFSLYVHDEGAHAFKKEERDWARRFLIDLSLTRLGPLQVDGLIQQKKLDLVVRTDVPLPETLRMELRAAFQSSLEGIRHTGALMFQAHKTGWIHIKQEGARHLTRDI